MQNTRITYSSKHDGVNFSELDKILQSSRKNNHRSNISGALIVSENYFLQVLEGPRAVVAECFMRIAQDSRHRDLQVISAGDVAHRLFPDWQMNQILTIDVKDEILARYLVDNMFRPMEMSEGAILELCHTLSSDKWRKDAA